MTRARRWSDRLAAIAAASIVAVLLGYVWERAASTPTFNAEVYALPTLRYLAPLSELILLAVLQLSFSWFPSESIRTAALTAIALVVFLMGFGASASWDIVGAWLVVSGLLSIVAAALAWMTTKTWRQGLLFTVLFSAALFFAIGLLSVAVRSLG